MSEAFPLNGGEPWPRQGHWVLDDANQPCRASLVEWADYFESANRVVERTELHTPVAVVVISTVFLGIDHNFYDNGPPVLFESMTFGGPNDGDQVRYRT